MARQHACSRRRRPRSWSVTDGTTLLRRNDYMVKIVTSRIQPGTANRTCRHVHVLPRFGEICSHYSLTQLRVYTIGNRYAPVFALLPRRAKTSSPGRKISLYRSPVASASSYCGRPPVAARSPAQRSSARRSRRASERSSSSPTDEIASAESARTTSHAARAGLVAAATLLRQRPR